MARRGGKILRGYKLGVHKDAGKKSKAYRKGCKNLKKAARG